MTAFAMATLLLVLSGATPPGPATKTPETVEGVPFYRRVSDTLAAAGQPTPAALARLKDLGFRTVVNLRAAGEPEVDAEEAAVRAAGLRYVHVPVTPATLSMADADRVSAILDDPEAGPVLVHCSTANRVGGVWAVVQAKKGVPYEEALAQGRAAGLTSAAMVEAVNRVLGRPAPGQ